MFDNWVVPTEFTLVVADTPVGSTSVTGRASTDPNPDVADTPVNWCVGSDVIATEPTALVADKPDKPIALSGTKAPTALVADKPDRPTECSSSVSKPSEETKPKPGRVIVAFVETDAKAFTEAVALKPVKPTTSFAITLPTVEVTLKPVNGLTDFHRCL